MFFMIFFYQEAKIVYYDKENNMVELTPCDGHIIEGLFCFDVYLTRQIKFGQLN